MATDLIISALARLPVFQGLTTAQLAEIERRAKPVIYHPGSTIMEENAEGQAAILILSGEAARVSGPELKSRREPIPTGALLGETAMLIEATYGSTIVARSNVRALQITRDKLHAHMLADPAIADQLVQSIAQRLTRMASELRRIDAVLAGSDEGFLAPRQTHPELPAPAQ
jgi:CRP-like cAMP-binding protein